MKLLLVVASAALVVAGISGQAPQAPQAARTVLDGAYTDAQASRGENEYGNNCARCHGADLDGGGAAPTLHTLDFLDRWREDHLATLFQFISTNMPQPPGAGPGGLKQQQYLDIVAFLLQVNGLPSGSKELTIADLETQLVGVDGPKPLPPSALVRVVGCLAHPSDSWMLTRSSALARVRSNGDTTNPAELEASVRAPLGNLEYRLPNLSEDHKAPDLLAAVGKKVQVKGVVNGQGSAARISVLSFSPLGQNCQ
jgi:mono/diheme cytochrome c family protein